MKGENSIAMSGLGCTKPCLVPRVFHFHVSVIEGQGKWRVGGSRNETSLVLGGLFPSSFLHVIERA